MSGLLLVQDSFLHMGEASRNAIDHCLQAFNAMGLPKVIKTDDGPAYTRNNFTFFIRNMVLNIKLNSL